MLKVFSLFEKCVTLLIGTWSVACKQSVRSVGGQVHNAAISQLRPSSERKLWFQQQDRHLQLNSLFYYVFSSSNSLFMFSLQLSDLSDMQEQARSMPSTLAVLPSPGHNIDSSEKVRTFDKELITTNHFHCRRFVRVLWLRHAELHDLVEVCALTGECSPPDQNRSIFPFKLLSISL